MGIRDEVLAGGVRYIGGIAKKKWRLARAAFLRTGQAPTRKIAIFEKANTGTPRRLWRAKFKELKGLEASVRRTGKAINVKRMERLGSKSHKNDRRDYWRDKERLAATRQEFKQVEKELKKWQRYNIAGGKKALKEAERRQAAGLMTKEDVGRYRRALESSQREYDSTAGFMAATMAKRLGKKKVAVSKYRKRVNAVYAAHQYPHMPRPKMERGSFIKPDPETLAWLEGGPKPQGIPSHVARPEDVWGKGR